MTTIATTIELGDGVVLRPLAPADADDIAAAVADEAIVRWTRVLAPYTRAHALDFVAARTARRLGFQFEGIERAAHPHRDMTGAEVGRGDMRRWGLLSGELVSP